MASALGAFDTTGLPASPSRGIQPGPVSTLNTIRNSYTQQAIPQTPSVSRPTQGPSQAQPAATYSSPASAAFQPQPVTQYPGYSQAIQGQTQGGAPLSPQQTPSVLQDPGNNWTNPGYGEQALQATQNQWLNDPFASSEQQFINQAGSPSQGEQTLNNMGTLSGSGQGSQYWNQQQGQFNGPTSGQQYTQQATSQLGPTSSSAFYNTAMGNYPSAGQYQGGNNSLSQYGATQAAFGSSPLPSTTSADPYYDRSEQLGVQAYNNDAASRGVYGSSQTLSGVGNVVSGIEAARAQNAFQNQMSVDQEERQREALLGTQAQAADTTGINAFNAGTQATQTYGNLASSADQANTNQYIASTSAMNQADANQTQRLSVGGTLANNADTTARENYTASANAATQAGQLANNRTSVGGNLAGQASSNDTARLQGFTSAASSAENQRQGRESGAVSMTQNDMNAALGQLSDAQKQSFANNQQAFDDWYNATIAPQRQAAGLSQQQIDAERQAYFAAIQQGTSTANNVVNTVPTSK